MNNRASGGMACKFGVRAKYGGLECGYRIPLSWRVSECSSPVPFCFMLLQLIRVREAMVFAMDMSSRATRNITQQLSMPHCLMLIQLVFTSYIGVFSCLTASFGTIYGISVLGEVMSFHICLRSKRFCEATNDRTLVSFLVDGIDVNCPSLGRCEDLFSAAILK